MNQKVKWLRWLAVAVVVLALVAAFAPATAGSGGLAQPDPSACGGLRMDEFYACQYGGWQPTEAAAEEPTVGTGCGHLALDSYYACRGSGGWEEAPAVVANGETPIGVSCGGLRSDEYYACVSSGWRPSHNHTVLAR